MEVVPKVEPVAEDTRKPWQLSFEEAHARRVALARRSSTHVPTAARFLGEWSTACLIDPFNPESAFPPEGDL